MTMTGNVKADDTQYWPEGPQILSPSVIVMEANTGTILYDKNSNERNYPASITKILTTLLAIENSNMSDVVTFSNDAVHKTEGSSIARDVDEQMTMEQCLYAVMLESANECAYAVGEHVAGDIDSFVKMMNERAAAIGCKDTNFTNCNGLPDEAHYTSAYDMALIAKEAYKNETFRIICNTKTYTIPFTNKHIDEETNLRNHHAMLYPLKTRQYLYDYCTGGKTGYTIAANSTLVTYAEKDGMNLICVFMNAENPNPYTETRVLFDFCFDNFKIMNVRENETKYTVTDVKGKGETNSHEPFVTLDEKGSIILPIAAEFSSADSKIIYDNANAQVAGRIQYTYADRIIGGADIVSTNAIVDGFKFHNKKEASETDSEILKERSPDSTNTENGEGKIFQVNLRVISIIVIGIIVLALLILAGKQAADKFYIFKHKISVKRKEKPRYKIIKKNKMYRKRRKK